MQIVYNIKCKLPLSTPSRHRGDA